MQINHNIRAMVTQHALFQNNNAMTKSLEKLSTGLRINRAQDDAAGLAMSEQMRTQIRALGKAKQNSQDGQAALQIAEGALAEITNMMQRQRELAIQSANGTLTSTERAYLNDEFQALTKEIDRIAKNTDYNGKNVLLFDVDPNKSFGATKLNPYNREISSLDAAKTLYDTFGSKLAGGLSVVSGDGIMTEDVKAAKATFDTAKATYDGDKAVFISDLKDKEKILSDLEKDNAAIDKAISFLNAEILKGTFSGSDDLFDAGIDTDSTFLKAKFGTGTLADIAAVAGLGYASGGDDVDALKAALTGAKTSTVAASAAVNTAKDALKDYDDLSKVVPSANLKAMNDAKDALEAAKAPYQAELDNINDVITAVNKVITDLNGIQLNENNINEVMRNILTAGDVGVNNIPTLGGDKVFANVINAFSDTLINDSEFDIGGSDALAIKELNAFLRDVRDAYEAYNSAGIADPRYGDNSDIKAAATQSMADTLGRLFSSDNDDILNTSGVDDKVNEMNTGAGNYNMLAEAANMISGKINGILSSGALTVGTDAGDSTLDREGVAVLAGIFGDNASPQVKNAINSIMQFDVSKMADANGDLLAWDDADKQIAVALQKTIGELQTHYKNFAEEQSYRVGEASSEVLHVGPNYSTGVGGADANEIKVNYAAVDVKGLGLESQDILTKEGADRAIDRLEETIKVISGNRAAIGTYINRLDFTINNIASMQYNTQDAESRIRDTDFSKETTEFTKNQIMVQSATSMLAQANSLPQSVLGLIG
ncbi:MAG: hypothetical protein LBB36_04290 [Fibromonadaceae bacterium]|nr:hypothetical protein [Fibromonadaceae bacterium]